MKLRQISKHTKLKIYTTVIKPILLYGCEMWAKREQMKYSFKTWEQEILRIKYGPIKVQNIWRI